VTPTAAKTRVVIADDHAVVRRGVRALIEPLEDFEVCGEAEDGLQAVQMADTMAPDIIILDVSMPGMNGMEAAASIHERTPATQILFFSLHSSEELAHKAFRIGARAYVLKSDAERDLVTALRKLQQNQTYISPAVGEIT
jgi:DNA-binding NarL/FixJ family response regulator